MKVTDPGGQVWHVHRRWLPWNPGKSKELAREVNLNPLSMVDGADDPVGCLVLLAVGIVVAILAPLIFLVLFTGIELLILLAILPFAIAGRVLFGRRWWIQVRRGRALVREEMVGDWAASGRRIKEVAAQIRVTPPELPPYPLPGAELTP